MRGTCLAIVEFVKRNTLFFVGILKYVCDIVVKKFTVAISSSDKFLLMTGVVRLLSRTDMTEVANGRQTLTSECRSTMSGCRLYAYLDNDSRPAIYER